MKRLNIALDEDLLERARQVSGERTYSGAVTKALKELVRVSDLKAAIQAMQGKKDFFFPGYFERIRPNSWYAQEKKAEAERTQKPPKKATRGRRAR
jgi:hypothetical protein